jgi:hypothetical protein
MDDEADRFRSGSRGKVKAVEIQPKSLVVADEKLLM